MTIKVNCEAHQALQDYYKDISEFERKSRARVENNDNSLIIGFTYGSMGISSNNTSVQLHLDDDAAAENAHHTPA